jgi:hypothetical protein
MSCVSHYTVDILETSLDCTRFQFFFLELIPLCYVTLKTNRRISSSVFNKGFQASTAGLTTVWFWHCVDSWIDMDVSEKCASSIFRVTELRAGRRWIIGPPADNSVTRTGGSPLLKNVCVQNQKTSDSSFFDVTKRKNVTLNGIYEAVKCNEYFRP